MAGPNYGPGDAFRVGVQAHDRNMDRIRRKALSPRQLELNRIWGFYCAQQYDGRTVTWDGRQAMSPIERDQIARTQVIPPGFYDPGGKFDEVPLSLRRPIAPYHVVRVVVNRFTGLLFSAKKHPQIRVASNPKLQDWVEGLVKAARLWIRFAYARTFGGAMGSVGVSFRFRNGRPVVEVHDPRWCVPTFKDRSTGEISRLEIRYMYPQEEYAQDGPDAGILKQVWYWYRRIIDEQRDTVFAPAPVDEGEEPVWVPRDTYEHGFGEVPGVWIRNSQTDDVDGECDCHGEHDSQEAIDRLLSQADQGSVENCDPTLLFNSDELKLSSLKKGSGNAIKVEKGGDGKYIEMTGSGVDAALKVADVHRRNFLEVVQCVLDSEKTDGTMTATEIERRFSSMHERGDLFREQYGEHGIKIIVAKMVRAAVKLRASGPVDPVTGLRQVGVINLPPKVVETETPDGIVTTVTERELPTDLDQVTDDMIELTWPQWIERGPADASSAANAVATARTARALDQESAVQYLAPFFGIDNPAEALDRLRQEGGALDDDLMKALIKAGQAPAAAIEASGGPAPGTGPAGQSPGKPPTTSAPPTPDAVDHHAPGAPPPPAGSALPHPNPADPVRR